VFLLLWAILVSIEPLAYAQMIVTASQVNGTWKTERGTFKILALGKQRLRVEFSGIYTYNTANGPSANEGKGSGIALLEGDTATFKPEGAEDECAIPLRFVKGKLVVTQVGICGFGLNVTAAGTYRRVSSRKPTFSED
jgi:hypothetical protein